MSAAWSGRRSVRLATGLACAALLACGGGGGTEIEEPPEGVKRVLFIGNSLTYTNNLPGMVQALAAAAGEALYVETVAGANYSLEDHWSVGSARRAVERGGWDVVVLQQGPSAAPESRELLIEYTRRFAGKAREVGAETALYMVWPSTQRFGDFDRVSESYRLAAEDVGGLLFPAGEAWRAAWRSDPGLPLYSSDGFHPSAAGTYAAALVIYGKLYGRSPVGLPAQLRLRSGSTVTIAPAAAGLLQRAADEANAAFGAAPAG
ncbi:MAG TPA: hypothetical protein VF746_31680 [Longimicrobium sp.]|jgi:hypothetical protein